MNIHAINNQTSFKALLVNNIWNFSSEQVKIVNDVKNIVNKTYPHDKTNKSYIDFLEKDAGFDLVLKNNNDNSSVDMFIKETTSKNLTYLENISSKRPVNEEAFLEYCDTINANMHQSLKLIKFISGFILACTIATVGAIMHKSCTKETIPTVKEQVINPVKDSLQKVGKDTLKLTKQLMKK